MTPRNSTLAAAGGLLVVVATLAMVVTHSSRHAIASNFVPPQGFVAELPAGGRVCQPGERVPAGTGAIRARIGTYGAPGPQVELSITRLGGRAVRRGELAAGFSAGDVEIPFEHVGAVEGEVCLRNAGPGRIAVAGGRTLGDVALVDGNPASAGVALAYLEPEARSWWAFAPELSERVDRLRDAPPGALTLPLYVVLAVGLLAGAVAIVLREARR